MICHVCEREIDAGSLTQHGMVCDDQACRDQVQVNLRAELEEARATITDNGVELPQSVNVVAFERFMLGCADWLLQSGKLDKAVESYPLLNSPWEMSLALKQEVLRHLPKEYLSTVSARGYERLFHGGTYRFIKPVPAELVIYACRQAGLLKEIRT